MVVATFFFSFLPVQAFSSTVTYKYDAAGRLTGVECSNGTNIQYTYDAAGNMVTKKVLLRAECPECSVSPVVLTNVTFNSGTFCECSDSTSITIGTGVTIETGANIIFKAPKIAIKSGFRAKEGAVVKMEQP